MSLLLASGTLLLSWHLGLSVGYSQLTILDCFIPFFNYLALCTSFQLLPHLILSPVFCCHDSSFFSCPPSTFHDNFFPLLSWTEASTLRSLFFLSFIWSVSSITGMWSFLHKYMYQWVHTMCVLLWLGYLTQGDIFSFHPFACKFHEVIDFNSWIVLHWVKLPHFLYSFPF